MIRYLFCSIILCISIVGCDRQVTTLNANEDIHQVEEFVVNFYKHIYEGETDSVFEILDTYSLKRMEFEDALQKVSLLHGDVLRIDILSISTERVELGYVTNLYSQANVKVTYSNSSATETLGLRLVDNELRLTGYHSKYP